MENEVGWYDRGCASHVQVSDVVVNKGRKGKLLSKSQLSLPLQRLSDSSFATQQ